MKRITLTPSLSKRIVRDVREGVPPQVAARKAGVPLERFLDWMSRAGRKYQAFAQAIDQAVAVATAENVMLLKRAARRGKFKAALTWLQSQAPTHFPAKIPVSITQNTTLIEQIKLMEAREGQLLDPRLALDQADEERPALEAATQDEEEPWADVFEPNVISDREPNIIEMIRALPPLPSAT